MTAPRLQVALDTFDLPTAVAPLQKVGEFVDVIEVGTILCLAEGMRAVELVRAMYPTHPVLADVRIVEAGNIIARQCFDAGASWVSCVAGASLTTIGHVVTVAQSCGGEVQVELGETYATEQARAWCDLGVQHVIVKRSRDKEAAGDLRWRPEDLDRIHELAGLGFTVTVTGGVVASGLDVFAGAPVGVVIAGRAILQAEDPGGAARDFREALKKGLAVTAGVSLGIYEKALVSTPDWSQFFGQVADAGFTFCDLSVDETAGRAARLDWDGRERDRVRAAARSAGVQIGGLCLSLHRAVMPGSVDPDMRRRALDVYRKAIRLAVDLGVTVVQVAGYYAYYEPEHPLARQRYLETLQAAVPLAARAGVVLAVENVDGRDISAVGDAMAVVREIGSPWLQLYPDIGNIAEHGGDAATELREAEGHVVALHVKDAVPGQPRRVAFGAGDADFPAAFAELARQRWSGRMMLEMWNDDSPDSVAKCCQARHFIESHLAAAGLALAQEGGIHA